MSLISLDFFIQGRIAQNINIINGEDKNNFFNKIKNGIYCTSINGHDVMDGNLEVVGKVTHQIVFDETEFNDFERRE